MALPDPIPNISNHNSDEGSGSNGEAVSSSGSSTTRVPSQEHQKGTSTSQTLHTPSEEDVEANEVSPKAERPSNRQRGFSATTALDQEGMEELRRRLSRRVTELSTSGNGGRKIDPSSDDFDFETYIRQMLAAGEEEGITKREIGVVAKNLTVLGSAAGLAYGSTMLDVLKGPLTLFEKLKNKRHQKKREIISNFTLSLRPGEMLLVLGRPGAGCSTLLKTLANYTESFDSITGEIDYDGISPKEMNDRFSGECAYLPEDDIHFPLLTVQETLDFAVKSRSPSTHARLSTMDRNEYTAVFRDVLLNLFGLRHVRHSKVGNDYVRGISGGERKRVSICEALTTRAKIMAHDNSTRGLDASTSLEYIKTLRIATDLLHLSTIASIYQAGEQLYTEFDKVCVIMEGRCIFFGKATEASKYFNDMGYLPHDRQTTPDFLVSVTDPTARLIKDGYESKVPKTAAEFADAYLKSDIAKREQEAVDKLLKADGEAHHQDFKQSAKIEKAKHLSKKSPYNISYPQQVRLSFVRRAQLLKGDFVTLAIQTFVNVFQALIIGSVYFQTPNTTQGFFSLGGVIFFAIREVFVFLTDFNSLVGLSEIPAAFSQRPILVRQRRWAMAKPSADALAQTFVDWVPKTITITVFDIILYFMAGLSYTASQFFVFLLITLVTSLCLISYFRMLAAISPAEPIATLFGGLSVLIFVITVGYAIPRPSMLGWYRWYSKSLNPLSFSFEALLANEFFKKEVPCANPIPSGAGYNNIPTTNQACPIAGYNPQTGLVNGAQYILQSYTYTYSHVWRNFGIILGFWVFFVVVQVIATDRQKDVAAAASVTLFKRGEAPDHLADQIGKTAPGDVEAAAGSDDHAAEPAQEVQEQQDEQMDEAAEAILVRPKDVFTWRHVNYDIKVKDGDKRLLADVSGFVRPGQLTALMGESGAGKTTLLNVLAQRTTSGVVTGDMLVSGKALTQAFQSQTAYCLQQDVHLETATVREALQFSAVLRQPHSVSKKEKFEYVEEVIKLLEMEDYAEALIGEVGSGLGVEQRKKLTIGVELAAKPNLLLFLDEPTSGLDSQSAWAIIKLLKKLAAHGQAILCTIHQPSGELFTQFDRLLLLQKGGKTVYFGELGKNCKTMLDYFAQHADKKCPEDANPAEYMLDVIGAGATAKTSKDWHSLWAESDGAKQVQKDIDKLHSEYSHHKTSKEDEEQANRSYAASFPTQMRYVLARTSQSYWRNVTYLMGKIMLNIFAGLWIGFTFFKAPQTTSGLQVRLFAVFMALVVSNPLSQGVMAQYLKYRALYEVREKPAKMYNWVVACLAPAFIELVWTLVGTTAFFVCWCWTTALTPEVSRQGYLYAMYLLFAVYYSTFAMALASIAPNAQIASLLFATLFSFVIIFCGVVQPAALMPDFWNAWMTKLTPFTYVVEGLLTTALGGGVRIFCEGNEFSIIQPPNGRTCANYLDAYINARGGYLDNGSATSDCRFCQYSSGDQYLNTVGYNYRYRARDIGIVIAYCAFNFFILTGLYWALRVRGTEFKAKGNAGGSEGQTTDEKSAASAQNANAGEKSAKPTANAAEGQA